ncbi:hypothetical protein [Amycolatopsis sp. CFH S0078]|uniref:hypothetical protein n=1 Tax=Amycolatopsis sp. CFH S0078 TaxID=1644108 RepID=UPI00106E7BC5|nr:hypothetical protein [Amycolatopsis sp. CFH S0078]
MHRYYTTSVRGEFFVKDYEDDAVAIPARGAVHADRIRDELNDAIPTPTGVFETRCEGVRRDCREGETVKVWHTTRTVVELHSRYVNETVQVFESLHPAGLGQLIGSHSQGYARRTAA